MTFVLPNDMPRMPSDWWPEEITVHGRQGKFALQFKVKDADDLQYFDEFRRAFWEAIHMKESN